MSELYEPPVDEIRSNPIWSYLAKNSFDWLLPRSVLREKSEPYVMISRNPTSMIPLENRSPLLAGMYYPLAFRPGHEWPDNIPPIYFSGIFHKVPGPTYSEFDKVVAAWDAELGPPLLTEYSNSRSAYWTKWPAQIQVSAFPRELNPNFNNPKSWDGDPATIGSIHISLHTGVSSSLSEAEKQVVTSARELNLPSLPPAPPLSSQDTIAYGPKTYIYPVEFYRRLERSYLPPTSPSEKRTLLQSEDGQYLIDLRCDSVCIIPIAQIDHLEVFRLIPAKGSGGSSIRLALHPFPGKLKSYGFSLTRAEGPDDLTEYGQRLGLILHRETKVLPYEADC